MDLFLFILDIIFAILAFAITWFIYALVIDVPNPKQLHLLDLKKTREGKDFARIGNNWIRKNKYGIWEVYIEGGSFERGVIYGKLCQELIREQEDLFVNQVESIVPSSFKRGFLKLFVGFFNRKLAKHIPKELREEIYGVSFAFSDKHNHIGPKFYRKLNYHAAHDIGHALEELNMVGCTSFATNNSFSEDGKLLVGRTFDFYMGDEFAKDKVLTMVRPDEGFPFVMYSWAGLMGVVSGMNNQGLTITLNASKSTIPFVAKEPISVLAREIIQYAKNIEEAIAIAKKRSVFVSESLLIASANDKKAVILEKSPSGFDVFESQEDFTVCANHYQSDLFKDTKINLENIEKSDSNERFVRMHELLDERFPMNVDKTVDLLRNKEGVGGKDVSLGNPKSINQLIAHHATVMQPEDLKIWFSTAPFQLGGFVHYNLGKIFEKETTTPEDVNFDESFIAPDSYKDSDEFKRYERYRAIKKILLDAISYKKPIEVNDDLIEEYIACNPNSYIVFMTLGEYFYFVKEYGKAKKFLQVSLTKELASLEEKEKIEELIKKCK